MKVQWLIVGVLVMLFQAAACAERGDEFRVDTKVSVKDGRRFEEFQSNRTLFRLAYNGPEAYDFVLGDAPETVYLSLGSEKVVVLDPKREVKCELSLVDINRFVLQQRSRAKAQDLPFFAPKFEVAERGSTLTFANPSIEYEVELVDPGIPHCHGRYEEFTVWYARLNAMRPNSLPPSARVFVSKSIAQHSRVPKSIQRTTIHNRVKSVLKSEHHYVGSWNNSDRRMVEKAQQQIAEFRAVNQKDFFYPHLTAAK